MSNDSLLKDRTVSEVILDLEKKIDTLTKLYYNSDMLLKNILNKLNSNQENKSTIPQEIIKPSIKEEQTPDNFFTDSDSIIEESKAPTSKRRDSRPESYKLNTPATPISNQDSERVPVMQLVKDYKNKNVFMAEVIVSDSDNNIVLKTKTNAAGKWQAYLKPDRYLVKVLKVDQSTKRQMEKTEIIIVSHDSTISDIIFDAP